MYLTCVVIVSLALSLTDCQPVLEIRPSGDSFTKPIDSNVVFTCNMRNVRHDAIVQLSWFNKHGQEIVDTSSIGGRRMYVEDDGPATRKLYINVAADHQGTYTCSGSVDGNQQSKSFSLNLFKDITYDDAPPVQHPVLYSDAIIACRVSGQPKPIVSWRYRGLRLQTGGRYTLDTYGLRIQNITEFDNGMYYCRAEVDSDGRYDEKQINVTVYVPPVLAHNSSTLFQGRQSEDFSISCQASGFPSPKYVFNKDGSRDPVNSTDRIRVDSYKGNVDFSPLMKNDAGKYRCTAINDAGQDWKDIELIVNVPPVIYSLEDVTQQEGGAVTLVCLSHGDPAPLMSFRKAGNSVDYFEGNNENGRIVVSRPSPGRLELLIKDVTSSDRSNYTCRSVNKAGTHEMTGSVIVSFKPKFLSNHQTEFYTWSDRSRNMTCHSYGDPTPTITWLRNGLQIANNDTFQVFSNGPESNLQVKVRESDQSFVFGTYICRASNIYGSSDLAVELRRAMHPDKPQNLRVVKASTTIVQLAVDEPLDNGGLPVSVYIVDYDQGKSKVFKYGEQMVIDSLRPITSYVFRVRARNEVGPGLPVELFVTTDVVRAPSQLELTCDPSSNSAYEYEVTWSKSETGGLPISTYEFRFRKLKGQPGPDGPEAESDWIREQYFDDPDRPSYHYRLKKLEPDTWYQLEVRARNDLDWSLPNSDFFFHTADGHAGNDPLVGRIGAGVGGTVHQVPTFLTVMLPLVFCILTAI